MQVWPKKAKLYFLHNPEGNNPRNTSVSEPLRSWLLSFQTRSNTRTLSIVKSVAGMATDLALNYANFAPLNVTLLPYMSVLCYANFCSLKCFEQCICLHLLTSPNKGMDYNLQVRITITWIAGFKLISMYCWFTIHKYNFILIFCSSRIQKKDVLVYWCIWYVHV